MYISSDRVTMADGDAPTHVLSTEIASSTASSIYVKWAALASSSVDSDVGGEVSAGIPSGVIQGYRVHYQKVASAYVQYSHFLPPDVGGYSIDNLVADTYYKVCVVMYRNDTTSPERDCVDASTTSWHIPVSIGSSIGAVLALSIIVMIVLLSRCPSLMRHQRATASESSKYDSMTSSRYHDDHNEFSDTTTHCGGGGTGSHDTGDDDVFADSCEVGPGGSVDGYRYCGNPHHHHHYAHHYPSHAHPALLDRLCNGNKNPAFIGVGAAAAGVLPPRNALGHHAHHHHHHHPRTHSLGACGRSHSLERPRPHHNRRSQLMQLHSAHQSIQSEPAARVSNPPLSRPLHVSISDLPPAVHAHDPNAPVSSLLADGVVSGPAGSTVSGVEGGARAKTNIKDMPRTFHMSIDYDV